MPENRLDLRGFSDIYQDRECKIIAYCVISCVQKNRKKFKNEKKLVFDIDKFLLEIQQ